MFAQKLAARVNARSDAADTSNAKGAIAQEADADGDVDGLLHKIDKLIGHDQLESDVGMIVQKPLAEARQDFGPDVVGCCDANKASDAFVFVAGFADGAGQIVEGFSAALEKAAPGFGQLKLSRRSIDQRNSNLGLQCRDGSAHARLWLL